MSETQTDIIETRMPKIVLASILVIGMTVGAYFIWNYSNGHAKTVDELTKFLGVGFTFLAAVATLVVSIFNAYRTIAIERAKTDLSKQLELFKKQITSDVEFIKGKFAMDRTALQDIGGAVIAAYHALSYYQSDLYTREDLKNACKNLLSSLKYMPLLTTDEATIIVAYAQHVIYVKELYDTIPISSPISAEEKEKLDAIWKQHGGNVSKGYSDVSTMLSNKHHVAPSS